MWRWIGLAAWALVSISVALTVLLVMSLRTTLRPSKKAGPFFSPGARRVQRVFGIDDFLLLRRTQPARSSM